MLKGEAGTNSVIFPLLRYLFSLSKYQVERGNNNNTAESKLDRHHNQGPRLLNAGKESNNISSTSFSVHFFFSKCGDR
jgi:hypothetical protein